MLARATAGRNTPPRSIPRRIAAGFFACAAPDLDFVLGAFGPVAYVLNHRGLTHSLVVLPVWAGLVAWVLSKILREPGGWRALYGVCAMGIGAHIAGDWITSFGTMIFAPLSDYRAALGTTFIIDLWFSGIILAGLLLSGVFYKTKIPSVVASIVLCAYVGFQYSQKEKALEFGAQYAAQRGLQKVDIAAHPRAVSPFNWTVFVSDERVHRFAHINLEREIPRRFKPGDGFVAKLDAPYEPLASAHWQTRTRYGEVGAGKEAWDSEALGFFRWFAERPALDGVTQSPECYWFADLRFFDPGRDWLPFRFGACRDRPGGAWHAFERNERREPVALD